MLKIFTTDTCAWCHQTKQLFDKLKIEYTEANITNDPQAQADYEAIVGNNQKTVPVTTNGTGVVFGYNVPKLISLTKTS